ncbi:hypothetical protein [Tannerella forsythia]|nr:hypothetical protein [Tannerella forsythia]
MKRCIFNKESNADKVLLLLFCLSIILYVAGEMAYRFGQALAGG